MIEVTRRAIRLQWHARRTGRTNVRDTMAFDCDIDRTAGRTACAVDHRHPAYHQPSKGARTFARLARRCRDVALTLGRAPHWRQWIGV
jgi:hypothetical protein